MLARITQISHRLSGWAEWLAVAGLMGIVGVTCTDVLGAKLFRQPLNGSTEIVSMIQVMAMAAALAVAQTHGHHVRVDFLIEKASKRTKAVLNVITTVFVLAFFILLVWKAYELGVNYLGKGTVSGTARIPLYPSIFALFLCSIPMCAVLLSELLNSITEAFKK